MTPEEKGEQLLSLFDDALPVFTAQTAAIICVNEIIKAVDDFDNELYTHEGVRMQSHKEYYENVLHYIKSI
jgi:hypothetical protein